MLVEMGYLKGTEGTLKTEEKFDITSWDYIFYIHSFDLKVISHNHFQK